MRADIGSRVTHPEQGVGGTVIDIHQNPACLIRGLVIAWDDGTQDEWDETEFGPLEDWPNRYNSRETKGVSESGST